MKKLICFTSLFLVFTSSGIAQLIFRGPTLSAGMQLAVPRGEYASFYKGTPYGVNAAISIPLFGLPIEGGGGFSWNQLGSKGRKVVITDEFQNSQDADLRINGNSYTWYVSGRLRPFNGKIRPYGEVLAGIRTYSVKTKLFKVTDNGRDTNPLTEVSDRDFVWVTGWAVGLQYRLLPAVFLEGRFEKLRGDKAQYINPESISISQSGEYSYENHQSRTDQLTFSVGLAFSF